MLVVKEHRKLLLNLNDPVRVSAIIPGSKVVDIKGQDIVSVPHDLDTVRVLRNLDINAPSPILHYYDWPGRYKPFIHQYETSEFATLSPRAYVLNDMGSGKTVSVLWAFDYLRQIGVLDWVLIVSPLSTLERTWADEVFKHFPHLDSAVLHGTMDKRMKLANSERQVYIINHDGIKNEEIIKHFANKPGNGLIIIDELACFRNTDTARWKAMNVLVNGNSKLGLKPREWVWGLTGTPIPNAPTDAFGQCKLITPGSVPRYFGAFRELTMRKITQYKWMPKSDALATVHRVMQPAIRFKREDCIDLPPTTYMDRVVELSSQQRKLYQDMMRQFKAEYEGGQITAANEAIKLNKLLQIVCGVAYGSDGEMTIPAQPRVDEVLEIIEQASAKVIVFVPLTGALNALAEKISTEYTVAVVHGGVSKTQRDNIFSDFMDPNGVRVLIAQPGTMAHGLTLTAADTIIWYAPINSAEIYQQANARIVRPGQTRNTLIVRVQGSEVERRMYDRLDNKGTTQGALLGMFE